MVDLCVLHAAHAFSRGMRNYLSKGGGGGVKLTDRLPEVKPNQGEKVSFGRVERSSLL